MKFTKRTLSVITLACASAAAHAAPIITVSPWLAPNFFGSASTAAASQNAIDAQRMGVPSYGPAGPTQFNTVTGPVSAGRGVVTDFNSWMGVAQPSDPAYAGEYGNRYVFALAINGNGDLFSISQLAFDSVSTDPASALSFGFADGYTYSDNYVGVQKGPDGILGTADDILITSGDSALVDALYGRGSGNAFAAYCAGCTKAQQQAEIDAIAAYPGTPFTYTGTYSLVDRTSNTTITSNSGTFNIVPTPEPSSLALLGTGALSVVGFARRRFRRA